MSRYTTSPLSARRTSTWEMGGGERVYTGTHTNTSAHPHTTVDFHTSVDVWTHPPVAPTADELRDAVPVEIKGGQRTDAVLALDAPHTVQTVVESDGAVH